MHAPGEIIGATPDATVAGTEKPTTDLVPIIAGVLAAVVVVIIVAIIVIFVMKRRNNSKRDSTYEHTVGFKNGAFDNDNNYAELNDVQH